MTCLILDSPYTSDDDEMENFVYQPKVSDPTIKNLLK